MEEIENSPAAHRERPGESACNRRRRRSTTRGTHTATYPTDRSSLRTAAPAGGGRDRRTPATSPPPDPTTRPHQAPTPASHGAPSCPSRTPGQEGTSSGTSRTSPPTPPFPAPSHGGRWKTHGGGSWGKEASLGGVGAVGWGRWVWGRGREG